MQATDESIFRWINAWPDWLEPIFLFFSQGNKWWPVRIGLGLIAIYLLWNKRTRAITIVALLSWPIANEITDLLKNGVQMLRPCVELDQINLRVEKLTSFGTASAHAANMAALATAFSLEWRKRAWPWVAVAFFTGISRIYVGVHYPSQVLLGWLCGAAAAVLVWVVWKRFFDRAVDPSESQSEAC